MTLCWLSLIFSFLSQLGWKGKTSLSHFLSSCHSVYLCSVFIINPIIHCHPRVVLMSQWYVMVCVSNHSIEWRRIDVDIDISSIWGTKSRRVDVEFRSIDVIDVISTKHFSLDIITVRFIWQLAEIAYCLPSSGHWHCLLLSVFHWRSLYLL